MKFTPDIGIDLGTASVLIYVKGKGIVLNEPSVVAIDTSTDTILAVGEEARLMLGRTPGSIVATRPLKEGVISDYEVTGGVSVFKIFKPKIMVCVPSGVTEVEKKAVIDATMDAGAREVFLIEEPIAAAIGSGIDISKPNGCMVVDIGGGTTDIAVISLGGIVVSSSIKVAGDQFDDALIKYMRKQHSMLIGERTAEAMKMAIGTAFPRQEEITLDVRGRNLVSGLPEVRTISSSEALEALKESVTQIADAVHVVLEKTPPELSSDISDKGILMTGGGSLLWGLDKLISKRTGIDVYVSEDAVSCVARGTGDALNSLKVLSKNSYKKR